MKEYNLVIHSFEEAAYLVDFLEKHDLHGTLSDQSNVINCRSFMGILSRGFLKKKITLKVREDDLRTENMEKRIQKEINMRYTA